MRRKDVSTGSQGDEATEGDAEATADEESFEGCPGDGESGEGDGGGAAGAGEGEGDDEGNAGELGDEAAALFAISFS